MIERFRLIAEVQTHLANLPSPRLGFNYLTVFRHEQIEENSQRWYHSAMEIKHLHKDAFDLERGRAIGAFAELECALCWIVAEAGHLDHKTASVIFYANISMQPRVEIASALIEATYPDQLKIFWASACKIIDSLNKLRNKIVHWHGYPVYEGLDMTHTENLLIHPVVYGDKTSQLSVHDMRQFTEKAQYTVKVLNVFRQCFDRSMGDLFQSRAIDLFSKTELRFPPPEVDPFSSR